MRNGELEEEDGERNKEGRKGEEKDGDVVLYRGR